MRLRVQDVMTTKVVTVRERTSFRDLVRLLRTHHVSALPVVDGAGRVVGIDSRVDYDVDDTSDWATHARLPLR